MRQPKRISGSLQNQSGVAYFIRSSGETMNFPKPSNTDKLLSGGTCAGRRKACRKTSATHTEAEIQAAYPAQISRVATSKPRRETWPRNWAIRDEYFEKVYGNSYKPKSILSGSEKQPCKHGSGRSKDDLNRAIVQSDNEVQA